MDYVALLQTFGVQERAAKRREMRSDAKKMYNFCIAV